MGRKAIISDPHWNSGDYYGKALPIHGLSLARMVGHITYLSNESMHEKFGRALQGKDRIGFDFSTDFAVESYLHHQGIRSRNGSMPTPTCTSPRRSTISI